MKDHNKKHKRIFLLLLILTIGLFNSCSKESDTEATPGKPDHGGTTPSVTEITTDKKQYAPYEIAIIKTTGIAFNSSSVTGKIDDLDITIESMDSLAYFVTPNLENGKYSVSFASKGKEYHVPITITAVTHISSPDVYFAEVENSINETVSAVSSQIDELEEIDDSSTEYSALRSDIQKYSRLLIDYKTQYTSLTNEEKLEFAKYMAANKSMVNVRTMSLRTMQAVQDYESEVEKSKVAYVASVIFTVAHIPAMITTAKLAATPNPWVSAGAILAGGLIFTSYIINLDETITATERLTSKALKPYEDLEISQTIYETGEEISVDITAKYRSVMSSDENDNSNGSVVSDIVSTFNTFKTKYDELVNNLPQIFKPSYTIKSLKDHFKSQTKVVYNKYLRITNVSNPNVTFQQFNQPDGSIKVKAVTTANTDQNFTYDIEYTNSNFTKNLKKTIHGKVIQKQKDPPFLKGYYEVNYAWGEKLLLKVDNTNTGYSSGEILYYDSSNNKWFYPSFRTSFSAGYNEETDANQNTVQYISVSISTGGCLSEGFSLYSFNSTKQSFSGFYTSARCYHDDDEGTVVTLRYLGMNL